MAALPTPATTVTLGGADLAVIGGYCALVLWIGGRMLKRAAAGAEDFLLAGRSLTLPLFVGTLVSTWYGGLIGVGEIAYTDGLVTWLTQGGFWYLAYVIFALLFASRLSRQRLATLPDQIGLMHGPLARVIALLLNFLNVVPIAYMLSLGVLLHLTLGWPIWLGVLVGTAVATAYSLAGGFRAVVYTDLLQFGWMCVAVALLMIFSVADLGRAEFLEARLPPAHLSAGGSLSAQELGVWAIIALSTLVDPNFYHRCYAARDPKVARNGVLIAVGFWLLFDVCSTFSGLYARALLPGIDPRMAYPLLAESLLPAGLKGVFFAGLLATIMSTIDSYCFVGGMTISHDLYRRTWHPEASDAQVIRGTRYGVLLTGTLAAVLAMLFEGSFKAIWKTLGSLSSASVLVPMLFGLWGWRPRGAGATAMIGGTVGTLGWAALRRWGGAWAMSLEAIVPGMAMSTLGYLICGALDRGSRGEANER